MLSLNITEDDIQKLKYEMFLNHNAIIQKRITVLYLKIKGIKHMLISRICDIHLNSITNYIKMYNKGGLQAILETHYGTNKSILDSLEELKTFFLTNHTGSIKEAVSQIKEKAGIEISKTSVWKFFKRIGMNFLRAKQIPAKADPLKQEIFINEKLAPLISEAKKEKRVLLFMDAAHFVMGVYLSKVWCAERLIVKASEGRKRFNVFGAINAIDKNIITYSNTSYFDSHSTINFLEQIKQKYPNKKISIVLDNARYQHCKLVTSMAEKLNIELVFLPPYSPNLNIIERLWKFLKKKVLNTIYYENFAEFQKAINGCLANCNCIYKEEVDSLCSLNFQRF